MNSHAQDHPLATEPAIGIYLAFTHPRDQDSEVEFNDWYERHHIPEILSLAGVAAASRYRSLDPDGSHGYLTVVELEGDDLRSVVDRIHAAAPQRTPTTTMRAVPPTDFRLFELISRRAVT